MEFEVRGIQYRAGKLDARAQFHIVRRLAPFIGSMKGIAEALGGIDAVREIAKGGTDAGGKNADAFLSALPAIADVVAGMDDETADYIIFGLMACVHRKEQSGLGWPPVSRGRSLMYEDIGMMDMLAIATRAAMANMQDFFPLLRSALSRQGQKPSAQ